MVRLIFEKPQYFYFLKQRDPVISATAPAAWGEPKVGGLRNESGRPGYQMEMTEGHSRLWVSYGEQESPLGSSL